MGLPRILAGILLLLCAVCCGAVCNVSVASKGFQDEHEEASNTSLPSKRSLFGDNFEKNKEKVKEYLLRDVVREQLLIEWRKYASRTTTNNIAEVKVDFKKTMELTLKDVFHFLQFFPLLYRDVKSPVEFKIPVTMNTKPIFLVLKNVDKSGTFTAFHSYLGDPTNRQTLTDLSKINSITLQLLSSVSSVDCDGKQVLKKLFHSRLGKNFPVKPDMESVFMRGVEFLASTSILRKNLPNEAIIPKWLKNINDAFENERAHLENDLNDKIKKAETTKLRYELTASMMLLSSDNMEAWGKLDKKVTMWSTKSKNIKIKPTDTITLRELFKLLQSSNFFFGSTMKRFKVPIGGSLRTFWLSKARYQRSQIFVKTRDADWPDTTKRAFKGKYDGIVRRLSAIKDQRMLASMMITACTAKLNDQPDFENILYFRKTSERADKIRLIVEFLVIAMVAEAAAPKDALKKAFVEQVADKITKQGHFPEGLDMPHLDDEKMKTGRSPTMDDVVLSKLKNMRDRDINIKFAFSVKNFPIRKKGGTAEGRKYVYEHGNDEIPSYFIKRYADTTQVARRSCTGSK